MARTHHTCWFHAQEFHTLGSPNGGSRRPPHTPPLPLLLCATVKDLGHSGLQSLPSPVLSCPTDTHEQLYHTRASARSQPRVLLACLQGSQPWGKGEAALHTESLMRVGTQVGESRAGWRPQCLAHRPPLLQLCPLLHRAPHLHPSPSLGSSEPHLHLGPPTVSPLLPPAAGEGNSALSPLNPGELLIALHNIDSVKCDMKSIIKGEVPHPPHCWPALQAGYRVSVNPHTGWHQPG